jgi:hypothetical protein
MSLTLAMSLMGLAEFLLSAVLGFLFWRKGLHRQFPAMGSYLALRVASSPVLAALTHFSAGTWDTAFGKVYFLLFWGVYVANAVILFFVCSEIFRSALLAFSGLQRVGTIIFRWAALVSLIVSLSTVSFGKLGLSSIPVFSVALVRSVSVLELCLLAFLCISMNALYLTVRDIAFGIAFGFGLLCANDFVLVAISQRVPALIAPLQFVYEGVILLGLCVWVAYCVMPEPAPRLVLRPANSTLYRWNEIASALGRSGAPVAQPVPQGSFFLTDVERVVESVLARNVKNSESES